VKLFVGIFFFLVSLSCANAESWVCTYANDNGSPAITKLDVQNDVVIQGGVTSFKIITNDNLLLTATSPIILRDPKTQQILLGATTLMVGKQTGTFTEIGSIIAANDFVPHHGNCVRN
jgi:hypothetical protein